MSERVERIKLAIEEEGLDLNEFISIISAGGPRGMQEGDCNRCEKGCDTGCREACVNGGRQS